MTRPTPVGSDWSPVTDRRGKWAYEIDIDGFLGIISHLRPTKWAYEIALEDFVRLISGLSVPPEVTRSAGGRRRT